MALCFSLRKLIWAIDPFDIVPSLHRKSIDLLKRITERTEASIEPVFVRNDADTMDLVDPKEAMRNLLSKTPIPGLSSSTILHQNSTSLKATTEILSDYAISKKANTILVNSHGKSKLGRILLGSFAETLILHSRVPVLITGPNIGEIRPLLRILFPTDFNPHSKVFFREVVAIANALGAEITLFHSVAHPVEPILQTGINLLSGGIWMPLDYFVGKTIDRQTRRAELWKRWAEKQGISVHSIIHSEAEPILDTILNLATRQDANLIMMEEKAGPIAASLIGSITRQIIRNASCPVWIMRATTRMAGKSVPQERIA